MANVSIPETRWTRGNTLLALGRSPSPNLTLPGNCNYVLSNKIHLTGFYHACVWFDFYLHFLQRKDVKYSKGYCNPSLHSWTSQHYDHGDSQMDDTACWRTSRFIIIFLHDMWLLKEKRLKIIFYYTVIMTYPMILTLSICIHTYVFVEMYFL